MKRNEIVTEWAGWLSVFGFGWITVMCIFGNAVVPPPVANIGYFLFFVPWLAQRLMSGNWRYHFRKEHLLSYAMLLFFAFELFYLPTEGDVYLKKAMEKRYPLILFAITGLFGYDSKLTLRRMVDVMALVSALSVLVVSIHAGIWQLIVDPDRSYIFFESRTALVNTHMMFNFFLNVTLVGIWWIWARCGERQLWRKIFYAVAALLAMCALSISEGRNGLISFLFLALFISSVECWRRFKWRAVAVVALVVVAGLVIVRYNPRFQESGFHNNARNGYWHSAVELIMEKPLTGYGVNNAQEEFDKVNMKYQSEGVADYWLVEMNCKFVDTHNQFLQSMLEFGVFGLLILLSLYVLPVIFVSPDRRLVMMLVILLSVFQSMTDMFITGQFCTLFCVLTQSLLYFPTKSKTAC